MYLVQHGTRLVATVGESIAEETQRAGCGEEPLLRPVVQVALDPPPRLVSRLDDSHA